MTRTFQAARDRGLPVTVDERQGIHRLVVVADDDKTLPIGVLSTTDVVHAIAERARAAADAGGARPVPS